MSDSPVAPENLRGMNLINSPIWNKGTSFTPEERDAFALEGLLPPYVETLEEQVSKAYANLHPQTSDVEKHIYLRGLQDTNEVLFYRLLLEHPEELVPLIYRPTLARVCHRFPDIYRRPRGLFVSYPLRDRIPELLRSRPYAEVDVIVVTDGEQVFGVGDAGVNGLSVPVAKLSMHTLFGGIHPSRTLPIVLDVGTNNRNLLNDPAYLGWRHERISGQEYFDFVDEFVQAVKEELPGACLHWEDLAAENAREISQRYAHQLPTFNDNLQGVATATMAALLSALKVTGNVVRSSEIVVFGAGPDALTAVDYLRTHMENEGLAALDAKRQIWLLDEKGLLHDERRDLTAEQRRHAQPYARTLAWQKNGSFNLKNVTKNVRTSALIAFSSKGESTIREEVVSEMAEKIQQPIILTAGNAAGLDTREIQRWSKGRALTAACGTLAIFPALALASTVSRASRITTRMMLAAAHALANCSPVIDNVNGPLLPSISRLREVTIDVATAIASEAQCEGWAPYLSSEELRRDVQESQWIPAYPALVHGLAVS